MNIAIVENDLDLAEALQEYIELNYECNVKIATSYKEAEHLFKNECPDVAFIDIHLDKPAWGILDECTLNGKTVCIAMSATPKYKHDVKCDKFLEKPFDLSQLDDILLGVKKDVDKEHKRRYSDRNKLENNLH